MLPQGNNYLSKNININMDRYKNTNSISRGKRLGDRTLFSNSIDGKRYYSSLDAEIYLGDIFVDDVVQISWAVEQATLPLYGYNSYTFDDIAIGARQITGAFSINFTKSMFLFDLLKSSRGVYRTSLNTKDDPNDNSKLGWTSFFDKEHKPMWDKSFNIKVGFGDYNKQGKDTSVTILHCVQLTGYQQILDTAGNPIGEIYNFIAKDIRYNADGIPENEPDKNENNSEKENNEDINDISFTISASLNYEYSRYDSYNHKMYAEPILNYKYSSYGINVTNIKIKLYTKESKEINSTYVSIGKAKEGKYILDEESANIIYGSIKNTLKDTEKNYLYCSFLILYEKNGVNSTLEKNNVKIQIQDTDKLYHA